MKHYKKLVVIILGAGIVFAACEKEPIEKTSNTVIKSDEETHRLGTVAIDQSIQFLKAKEKELFEKLA